MANLKHTIPFDKNHLTFGVVFVCMIVLVVFAPRPPVATAPDTTDVDVVIKQSENVAVPARLTIPSLNLDVLFGDTLGLKENGEVEVPTDFDSVGWYQYSPKPGELGPAVVLGHVDSRFGPAVFYSLGQLAVGEELVITDTEGTAYRFVVEASERYEQNSFPTELVYGNLDYEGLRLITCSGWYDRATDRYSHNRVVFARLVK